MNTQYLKTGQFMSWLQNMQIPQNIRNAFFAYGCKEGQDMLWKPGLRRVGRVAQFASGGISINYFPTLIPTWGKYKNFDISSCCHLCGRSLKLTSFYQRGFHCHQNVVNNIGNKCLFTYWLGCAKWGLSENLQCRNGQTLSDPRTP